MKVLFHGRHTAAAGVVQAQGLLEAAPGLVVIRGLSATKMVRLLAGSLAGDAAELSAL